jgi:hypothetical protein
MAENLLIPLLPWIGAFTIAMMFLFFWFQDRGSDRRFRELQYYREEQRAKEEAERKHQEAEEAKEEARYQQYSRDQREEEAAIRSSAGTGTGGYIIVDLPEERRSLFHDLLKGFEEYARLKGYGVSF